MKMQDLRKYASLLFVTIFSISSALGLNSRNTTIAIQRSSDAFQGGSIGSIDRQFPGDASYLVPQMVLGIILPVAIIIGIGIIIIKLFIIGFMFLGRGGGYGGYGGGGYGGYGGYGGAGLGGISGAYPWRNDQQQTARSLLDKNGSSMPTFMSQTILNLIEKVSAALEKYEKYEKKVHN